MTEEWGVFLNHYMVDQRSFAAQIIQTTAKTVTFDKSPGHEYRSEPTRRALDWLIVRGLTEAQAKNMASHDQASFVLMDQEVKASKARHEARRAQLIADYQPR